MKRIQDNLSEKIDMAIDAHKAWKKRLDDAINTRSSLVSVSEATCDTICDFGKWLYGEDISSEIKLSESYVKVRQLHTKFHQQAGVVISGATESDYYKIEHIINDISQYDAISGELVDALLKWKSEILST